MGVGLAGRLPKPCPVQECTRRGVYAQLSLLYQRLRQPSPICSSCRTCHRSQASRWQGQHAVACRAHQQVETGTASLYQFLGVEPGCSSRDLRRAFRHLASSWHPDVGVQAEGPEEDKSRKFQALKQAYEVLKDPGIRKLYDQYGWKVLKRDYPDLVQYFQGSDTDQDEEGAWRGRGRGQRGEDVQAVVGLDLRQAVTGTERVVAVPGVSGTCPTCQGSGRSPSQGEGGWTGSLRDDLDCRVCRGSGDVLRTVWQPTGVKVAQLGECPACGGSGEQPSVPCPECGGEGRTTVTRRVNVRVPGGVDNNTVLRVAGCGHAGLRGGAPGDLLVRFMVHDDPHIKRRGPHLYSKLECEVWLAVLGGSVPVDSVSGERLLHVPAGSQHGDVVRLRNAGVAVVSGGQVEVGHHFFTLDVRMPDGSRMQPRERELLLQLQSSQD